MWFSYFHGSVVISSALFCQVVLLLLASTLSASSQAPSTASEWRQFRGNPRLTGVSTSVPPDTLKVIWSYEAGEAILSSPAVADGVVYVGVGNGDLIAVDLRIRKAALEILHQKLR